MNAVRRIVSAGVVLVAVLAAWPAAAGQNRGQRAGDANAAPVLTVQELERWFDSYVLLQAQDTLKLSDAQFPRFLPRLKALQDTRRRHLQTRRQIINALGKLARTEPLDDPGLREQMKALREVDARMADEMRRAYESLDEVLEPVQQARFRLFEEQIERRKIDLLMKARQRVNEAVPPAPPGRVR